VISMTDLHSPSAGRIDKMSAVNACLRSILASVRQDHNTGHLATARRVKSRSRCRRSSAVPSGQQVRQEACIQRA
jgi:hypothetical protein